MATSATNHLIRDKVGELAAVWCGTTGAWSIRAFIWAQPNRPLEQNGHVEKCNLKAFLQGGGDLALSIYVSRAQEPIGSFKCRSA
ncbi:hypothetical protein HHE02_02600 [Helicobacter heilmannii]|uniref:Uncharacterized protein n=1 Tax=Helicobacter heilmannii TaxID=35817 RepID=A0A0K2Y886_HELHE|nr:hypothetical protein BN341_950 [Helicobacter heilmannii ASB1.4]CRF45986.1 hypothetical protein HHE014_09710 [Helicobacter heilmannii]CRF46978.1 hypothetical protein HHE02_02600 [Helicobacter heilmannii]CRF49734.1 hypothetical protein HHE03_13970 [Helicobacter heilmannii]CRF51731.1 hypothetical protein HHE06_16300 [Helicobacter heilmannii]